MSESENWNPFDLFLAETNNEDYQTRIQSIRKLSTVAVALDTERTRSELLPFVETLTDTIYCEDEILQNLAEQLGNFMPFVGGQEYCYLILDVLEKICTVDETVVRETAVDSIRKIGSTLEVSYLENNFVPMVLRLATSEWFTSKCSSTALFAIAYTKVSEEVKTQLRREFRILCQDDSPLVRRSASISLIEFVGVLEIEHLKSEFVPVFHNLSKDIQDSVRLLSVDIGIRLASKLTTVEIEEYITNTLNDLYVDSSWRVRYQIGNQINNIQLSIGPKLTGKYLLTIITGLVHDLEPQVREICAKNIVLFSQILQNTYSSDSEAALDPTIVIYMVPLVKELYEDSNEDVKEALSSVITGLGPLLGPEKTKELLLPIITSSLITESTRVRENIISNLNSLILVVGISEIADTVLKIIVDLVNNSSSLWRTRRNLIVTISCIAKHSGKQYFDANLKPLYKNLLDDVVYAVRRTAPLILPILVNNFGVSWAKSSIVPLFLEFSENSHYLHRYACLYCMDEFIFPTLDYAPTDGRKDLARRKYLKNFRECLSTPTLQEAAIKKLESIYNINSALKTELNRDWVNDALTLYENKGYVSQNIKEYAEDTIKILLKDNNFDILTVTVEEIGFQGKSYLEGMLVIILGKFLETLRKLTSDPVTNVQMKAANTLKSIFLLCKSLEEELSEEWILKTLTFLSNTSKSDIVQIDNDEVEELTLEGTQNENIVEQIVPKEIIAINERNDEENSLNNT